MYKVFLDDMLFPIGVKDIPIKINNNNETYNLVSGGEVNVLSSPGLSSISVKLRIPHNPTLGITDIKPVQYYLDKLNKFKTERMAVQFIVIRTNVDTSLYNTNMTVSVEDYTIVEDTSNGNFTVIDIDLKQYPFVADRKSKLEEVTVDGKKVLTLQEVTERPDNREIPQSITAKEGDTLWSIARRYLGNGGHYLKLAELNGFDNPNGILTGGTVVRLE